MTNTLNAQRETVAKLVYAVIGAPVVTGRKMKDAGSRLAADTAHAFDEWAAEGRKVTERLQEQKVVEQVQEAVDLEQIQEQVERLRDQIETAMIAWRDNFAPSRRTAKPAQERTPASPKATAPKATTKKATKPAAAKKTATKPAAKKPAGKPATEK